MKSVIKFVENVVLRLVVHDASEEGKITPFNRMKKNASGRVYNPKWFQDKHKKGGLPIPDAVSVYVYRWLSWVKSMYGKETKKKVILQS